MKIGPANIKLHQAAIKGEIPKIIEILKKNPSLVNSVNGQGETALHLAVQNQQLAAAVQLIQMGAELNVFDYYGFLPLFYAYENPTLKKILIIKGALEPSSPTDLHNAALEGDIDQAETLLSTPGCLIDALDFLGKTPLHLAVQNGHHAMTDLLIKKGAKINLVDQAGYPPIYYGRDNKIKKLLIFSGAQPCAADFRPTDSGRTPLHDAIANKDVKEVKRILKKNPSLLENVNRSGQTALHLAVLLNAQETIIELLIAEADPNRLDPYGFFPVHHLIMNNEVELLGLLLEHGADPNLPDRYNQTPLQLAAQNGNSESIQLLRHFGAELDLKNQTNLIELSKQDLKHTELSRNFKREIGLDKPWLINLQNRFEKMLSNHLDFAKQQNKKLLLILGETHGDFQIYQIEKIMVQVAVKLGINKLFAEAATLEDASSPLELKALKKYDMDLIPVDTHPRTNEENNLNDRNKLISENISKNDTHGILIVGSDHLLGLLADNDSKIDQECHYVVPFNLTGIIKNANTPSQTREVKFKHNPNNAIHINFTEACFTDIEKVTRKWNKASSNNMDQDTRGWAATPKKLSTVENNLQKWNEASNSKRQLDDNVDEKRSKKPRKH